jgi:uncharacterized protein (DUF2336 family)
MGEIPRSSRQGPLGRLLARLGLGKRRHVEPTGANLPVLLLQADGIMAEVVDSPAGNPPVAVIDTATKRREGDAAARADLATKVARLIPDMASDGQTRLNAGVVEMLETLAQDALPSVRQIIAEAVCRSPGIPPELARRLADDLDVIVAVPILQHSPLLSDTDLLELIAAASVTERLTAIASRSKVSAPVADALVARFDVPAIAALLANNGASLREETLDQVVSHVEQNLAEGISLLHAPLALRPDLSARAARRIAGLVAASLVSDLAERYGLDRQTVQGLRAHTNRSLSATVPEAQKHTARDQSRDARKDHADGLLTEAAVNAAIDAGRRAYVLEALSICARLPGPTVRRIVNSRSSKPITALAWRAGFSMRTAMKIQASLGHIPPLGRLNARNGTDYPLSPDEMTLQIEFYVG